MCELIICSKRLEFFLHEKMTEAEINTLLAEHEKDIKCPKCGKSNFTEAKNFNLLVQSNLGNFTGDLPTGQAGWTKEPTYLRGETCQGIYVNFKNVLDSSRVKVPFGIAQIGTAFRNEITARQFIFRKREFEQMEMQYFVRSTPTHIAPVWYFTPFYAILRAVPDQRLGALLMGLAVIAFVFLPWLDRSPVKSTRYRGWIWKLALAVFTVSFLALMYLGLMPAEGRYVTLARIFTVGYFAFFVLMPFYTRIDPVKAVPERVSYHA